MPARWRAAPGSSPARRSTAKREALDAGDVPLDVPPASRPGGRGPMGCFGIENKHYRSHSMAKSIIHPVAAHERGVCAANPSASIGGRLARSDAIARLPIEIIMRERAHREQGFRASVGIIRPLRRCRRAM
jgi:hypothetical protein